MSVCLSRGVCRPARHRLRIELGLFCLSAWWLALEGARAQAPAPAEPPPTAALLSTSGAGPGDAGLDSVIHAALDKLGVVNITARPGMDLNAIQLALDCVGETAPCLRQVAAQNKAQIIIAPAIERSAGELVLTILYFDVAGDGDLRRVVRRQHRPQLIPETLDMVPDMLRELFRVSTPPSATAPNEPTQAPAPSPEEPPAAREPGHPLPMAPLIVAGAGVLVIAGGIVSGLMMQSTEDEYTKLVVKDTSSSLASANHMVSKGKTEATVANVLYGVGAATVVAGGVWFAIEMANRGEAPAETAMLPWGGPGQLGVVLVHRGGSL